MILTTVVSAKDANPSLRCGFVDRDANTAFQRMDVTRQLLDQANLALDLAQTRHKLGPGSIVELSQA
jgi:hypothetical protein